MQFMKDARQAELLAHLIPLQAEAHEKGDELTHLEKMVALARAVGGALSRETYEPGHFTASAFVLSEAGTELLLIRHKKLQKWLQPGGHIEPTDRDLVAAARREVHEETGLAQLELVRPFFDVDVHEIPAFGQSPAHLHHDVRALFSARSTHVVGGDDAAEARWFPLQEVAECEGVLRDGLGTDESVRRVARLLSSTGRRLDDVKEK
jgi:8-oxo-dGTP pyrophosphatase MutT (NUDIX family)